MINGKFSRTTEKVYQNRERINRLFVKGDGTSNDCPIKGAPEPLRDIFVSRVAKSGKSESLHIYLQSNGIKVCEIKQMSHIESKFK